MIANILKRAKENWQILATVLIAWSIFDLYNYYTYFGIEIQTYVGISEILLLGFPAILNGLISIILIILFFAIGLRNTKKETDPKKEELIKAIDEYNSTLFHFKSTFKYLKRDFNPLKFKNIFSIIIGIISLILETAFWLFIIFIGYEIYKIFISESLSFYPLTRNLRFGLLFVITLFFLAPLFLLLSEYFEKYAHKAFSNLTITKNPIIYFAIGFIFNGIISNRIQYLAIVNGQSNKKVSFIYGENRIVTDSSLVYIGSTQSYIFIRNNKDSLNMIFKKEEAKSLSIKNVFSSVSK